MSTKELTAEETANQFSEIHGLFMDDADIADFVEVIREAREQGRMEMREKCEIAVGFSNNAVAAIRAIPTSEPTETEPPGNCTS